MCEVLVRLKFYLERGRCVDLCVQQCIFNVRQKNAFCYVKSSTDFADGESLSWPNTDVLCEPSLKRCTFSFMRFLSRHRRAAWFSYMRIFE